MHKYPPTPPDPIARWEADGGAPAAEPAFDWRARLDFNPRLLGSPFIKGSWIGAADVVRLILEGWSWGQLAGRYPDLLDSAAIRACLAWDMEGRPER